MTDWDDRLAVEIELFGQLLPGAPRRQTLTLEHAMTVHQVAELLGIDPDHVGLVAIDGIQREMDDPVPPTCRLALFPPVSGGSGEAFE